MKRDSDPAGGAKRSSGRGGARPRAGRKPTGMRRVGVTVQLTPDEITRSSALWVGGYYGISHIFLLKILQYRKKTLSLHSEILRDFSVDRGFSEPVRNRRGVAQSG